MFKPSSNFLIDRSKPVLLLLIFFLLFVSLSLSNCFACFLQPCGHLLGKGWPRSGSLVCDVFLCFCQSQSIHISFYLVSIMEQLHNVFFKLLCGYFCL